MFCNFLQCINNKKEKMIVINKIPKNSENTFVSMQPLHEENSLIIIT